MTATRTHDEAGVTLIELLVSVSLLGLLMAALSGALIVGLRTTSDTQTSLGQSNAEQLVSTYLTKDIQAAVTVRTSGTSTCGNQAIVLETTTRHGPARGEQRHRCLRAFGHEPRAAGVRTVRFGPHHRPQRHIPYCERREPGEHHRRDGTERQGRCLLVDPRGAEAADMTCAADHNRSLSNVKWDGREGHAGRTPHGTEPGRHPWPRYITKEQYVVEAHP